MRIEVLGPLRVRTEHGEIGPKDFHGAKPKQILEILALERGRGIPKTALADKLWGEAPPTNYLATLETYVSVLRQSLDPGGRPRDSVVATERGGYRLDTSRVQLDLDDFDAAVAEASRAEPPTALAALRRALDLVRGDVVADEPYADWAGPVRETYRQRRVQALIDGGRLALLVGDPAAALPMAELAVELNPLAEPGYQVLMAAAYSLWRQDQALAAFERCRRLLAEELGADPLDQTVAMHLAILRHEDIAQLLQPAPSEAPPVAGTPKPLALLGRERELAELSGALETARTGQFTIAVVTGADGVGKTRLVETFAEGSGVPIAANRCSDLERSFPYLALSLALRKVLPDLAEHGLPVLDSLLERAERGQPFDEFARLRVMETLVAALRDRPPFILFLDDAQWADPETVTTLAYLQRRCPEAKVLVVLACQRAATSSGVLRGIRPNRSVDLQELSRADVEKLGGAELYEAAGGNPAHIASWLEARRRGLSEPFTLDLRERLVTACWDLGPQAYRLLCAAAAVPTERFSVELIAHLVGAPGPDVSDELQRLCEHDVLVGHEQEFAFRSPAVRAVLRGTLSPARRAVLVQGVADFSAHGPRRRATDLQGQANSSPHPRRRSTDVASAGAVLNLPNRSS